MSTLYTTSTAARLAGVSTKTLYRWRKKPGSGPPFVNLGDRGAPIYRYPASELEGWLNKRKGITFEQFMARVLEAPIHEVEGRPGLLWGRAELNGQMVEVTRDESDPKDFVKIKIDQLLAAFAARPGAYS